MPWRPGCVSGLEHVVARTRIVVPAAIGLEIHRRQFPDLARILDPRFEPAGLLLLAHLQPIFDEDDPGLDDGLLDRWRHLQKAFHLLHRREFHYPLDAGAIVPAAVEDHDFARCGQMAHITLNIHLRLLALCRCWERDDAIDARADPLGDRLDDPALAGAVTAFEHDHDFQSLGDDPELQPDQLPMQPREFALVFLAAQLVLTFGGLLVLGLFGLVQMFGCSHALLRFLYIMDALA